MMENKVFAGIRLRLLASYVDFAILALPITFLLWYAGTSLNIPVLVERLFLLLVIWILLFIIINLFHDIFFTHYFGGPIGKLLTGLKVVDENGNKLTLKRSFFRHTVGYQFSAILFGLGFLTIIKDPQKQAWHDKAVGSKVIVEKRKWPLALFILLALVILNLYILYSAFTTAFSGPLPEDFKTFMKSFETKQEKTKPSTGSTEPTAGWQTYRSEKLVLGSNTIPAFELKYPADVISAQPFSHSGAKILPILQSTETVSEEGHGGFKAFQLFLYARGGIRSTPQQSLDRYPDEVWEELGPIEKEIAGEKVYMIERRSISTFCATEREYYFSELILHFVYCPPKYEDIEDQILSTFRFVE